MVENLFVNIQTWGVLPYLQMAYKIGMDLQIFPFIKIKKVANTIFAMVRIKIHVGRGIESDLS